MGEVGQPSPVAVLGFGVAAISAVRALRDAGYAGAVTVVTDADPVPYSPVLTSYYAGGRIERAQCNAWADLDFSRLVDEIYAHSHVEALDAKAHEVVLADGRHIPYSKLIIATGAHPVAPGFSGVPGGFAPLMLRTMEDADRLREALSSETCRTALVAGTSMVALKAVEACLDQGVQPTLLGRNPHVLRGSAHPLIARRLAKLLEERGVSLRLPQKVADVRCLGGAEGHEVVFDNGDVGRYGAVIAAQGAAPNIEFAQGAVSVDRGIIVDEYMRSSEPDVYAAGDVAQALDLLEGGTVVRGLWACAVRQGRCAGRAIADELAGRMARMRYAGSIPENTIHVQDILFASAGAIAEAPGRRFLLREKPNGAVMLAYEVCDGEELLVGFNALSVGADEAGQAEDELGVLRKEVFRNAVR